MQDKTEGGQPVRFNPRVSSHHEARKRLGRSRASGIEINDHRPEEIRETEFGLPPSKYEGRLRKRGRPSLLSEDVVEAREQMGNGLFGFVAHVGKTESASAKFAVAGIDDEMMFFAKSLRKIDNVDAFVVRDAGEGF